MAHNPNYQAVNLKIDLNADDALNEAIDRMASGTASRIQSDRQLQNLLAKDQWTREDRVEWERKTSEIVSDELDKIPGLNKYRNENDNEGVVRSSKLNALSEDIENGTEKFEFDCEMMSIVEGVVLQAVENHFLPADDGRGENAYKVASSYFYTRGDFASVTSENLDQMQSHAFIMSSATGNVIEATENKVTGSGRSYQQANEKDYSFEKFVNGKGAMFGEKHFLYMPRTAFDEVYDQQPGKIREDVNNTISGAAPDTVARLSWETRKCADNMRLWKENTPVVQQLRDLTETAEMTGWTPDMRDMARDVLKELKDSGQLQVAEEYSNLMRRWNDAFERAQGNPEKVKELTDAAALSFTVFEQKSGGDIPLEVPEDEDAPVMTPNQVSQYVRNNAQALAQQNQSQPEQQRQEMELASNNGNSSKPPSMIY